MQRTIQTLVLLAATVAALPAMGDPARDADDHRQSSTAAEPRMITVMDVDMRGKPPYRRTVEVLPVTELARFEEFEGDAEAPSDQVPPSMRKRPFPIRMK